MGAIVFCVFEVRKLIEGGGFISWAWKVRWRAASRGSAHGVQVSNPPTRAKRRSAVGGPMLVCVARRDAFSGPLGCRVAADLCGVLCVALRVYLGRACL